MTPSTQADDAPRYAALVPVYNHGGTVADVVRGVQKQGLHVLVVDDGSTDGSGAAEVRILHQSGAKILHRLSVGNIVLQC